MKRQNFNNCVVKPPPTKNHCHPEGDFSEAKRRKKRSEGSPGGVLLSLRKGIFHIASSTKPWAKLKGWEKAKKYKMFIHALICD